MTNSRSIIHLQAFPLGNITFMGIDVLLLAGIIHKLLARTILTVGSQAIKDSSSMQDRLIDIFSRIERFFHRVEIYTGVTPTTAMT